MLGPTLVRGFAPGGIGPRDIASYLNIDQFGARRHHLLWRVGGSAVPDLRPPEEIGLKGALFADAGTLFGYSGQTNFSNFLGYTYCPPSQRRS